MGENEDAGVKMLQNCGSPGSLLTNLTTVRSLSSLLSRFWNGDAEHERTDIQVAIKNDSAVISRGGSGSYDARCRFARLGPGLVFEWRPDRQRLAFAANTVKTSACCMIRGWLRAVGIESPGSMSQQLMY